MVGVYNSYCKFGVLFFPIKAQNEGDRWPVIIFFLCLFLGCARRTALSLRLTTTLFYSWSVRKNYNLNPSVTILLFLSRKSKLDSHWIRIEDGREPFLITLIISRNIKTILYKLSLIFLWQFPCQKAQWAFKLCYCFEIYRLSN